MVALIAVPKMPTNMVFGTVVDIDGAVIDAELAFAEPATASTGFRRSTPP
jgi:hypothetical protein